MQAEKAQIILHNCAFSPEPAKRTKVDNLLFYQKLLETTQDELKLLKEQTSAQRKSSDESSKNFQDIKYTTNRQIQDLEKR